MGWAEVMTPDGSMRVYRAVPPGPARGAVIVAQEAFGVNDHLVDVAQRLADEGWYTVVPELFHRSGSGTVVGYGDFSQVLPLLNATDDVAVLADLDATIELLHQCGFGDRSIGIVGFCWGGRVAFLAALRRPLSAAVTFYGGGIVSPRLPQFPPLMSEVGALQAPWLGLFGDQDQGIPVADVETLRQELADYATVDHQIVRYPEAGHGFHNDARAGAYHRASAADGWARTLAWFADHLQPA